MRKTVPLTPAEFELLEVLWDVGEGNVRQVWDRVRPQRNIAYTTVMTVLDKMRRKGVLSQRRKGKAYFYSPLVQREEALELILRHVAENYFKGSEAEMRRFVGRGVAPPVRVQPSPGPSLPSVKGTVASTMDEFLL